MNIILFTHPSFIGSQSMPKYAHWLAEGMKTRGHTITTWSAKANFYSLPVPNLFKKWLGYIDQYIVFPRWVRKEIKKQSKNTLYVFTDHALGPWVPLVNHLPHIIHCHDFLAQRSALGEMPENATSFTGKLYQYFIRKGFQKGKNFISISHKTKKDLHRFLNLEPRVSEVIYNGLNQAFIPSKDLVKSRAINATLLGIDLTNGFILHVGGNQWYKNRLGVLILYDAWRKSTKSTIPLVMVGRKPTHALLSYKQRSEYSSDIYFLQEISDAVVRELYACATVFVFPSLAEGFGWPIAEAMASGCPVITTNEEPMTEVGGEAARYIPRMPMNNMDAWAKASVSVLEQMIDLSSTDRETWIEACIENSARFDSDLALDKIAETYQNVLNAYN